MKKRLAAIDIGTNTILMVIAELSNDGTYIIIQDDHTIARLGEGFGKSKSIIPDALERAVNILKRYKNICNELEVEKISCVGTSALRESDNRDEVLKILNNIIGCEIKVISGDEEALLSFNGTIENKDPSNVIDIGGGSTEIIYGTNETIHNRISMPFGAVKITERFLTDRPLTQLNIKNAKVEIDSYLSNLNLQDKKAIVYAVAGTPTTLASVALKQENFDRESVNGFILNIDFIDEILEKFYKLTIEEIKSIKGIHPDRADIITAGTLILKEIMKNFKFQNIRVSSKGLRYGVLKKMIKNLS